VARLDPIFERLLREGTELLFDTGSPAVMRTGAGDVPVLRQLLTAQQIAGIFSEVVPSEMRTVFPAPGLTTFEYGAPAGRVAVRFERNGGQVRAMVRPADRSGEEAGEAIELASAAEMLHEYMHGAPGAVNPGKPPTPAATGIPTGSQPGIPMGSQSGIRRGVPKDIQFRELPGSGKAGGAAPAGKAARRPLPLPRPRRSRPPLRQVGCRARRPIPGPRWISS